MRHLVFARLSLPLLLLAACSGAPSEQADLASAVPDAGLAVDLAQPPDLAPPPLPIGVNLEGVADWTRANMFADLMHQSRRFGTPDTPWDGKAAVDADGWPTGDFGVILFVNQKKVKGFGGVYKGTFTGKAAVAPVASSVTIMNAAWDANTNTSTFEINVPEGADQVMLKFTGTNGGVKKLSVIRPGHTAADLFTRTFLAALDGGFPVLRCMDLLDTNGNMVSDWASRAHLSDAQWTLGKGMPWEVIIALGNQAKRDLWINIPVRATDDYVRQLATLIKSSLDPGIHVYVEYSNEIWNFGFEQATWNVNQAVTEAQVKGSPLAWDGNMSKYDLGFRRVGLRIKQISDIFRGVFGDAAINTRIRPVLAGQIVNPYILGQGLSLIANVYGPPSKFLYALAGAPYFNLGDADKMTNLTADQVLQTLNASVDALPATNQYEPNIALATWYGLPFFAYEAGPDTFGANNIAAKEAATRDPRMKELCAKFLRQWFSAGMDLINWFTLTSAWDGQYGAWGLTDDPSVLDSYKMQAVAEVRKGPRPPLTAGTGIPGSVDARAWVGNSKIANDPYLRFVHKGSHIDYLFRADKDGARQFVMRVGTGGAGNQLQIAVDGGAPVLLDLPATATPTTWTDTKPVPLQLAAGLHVIRVTTAVETNGWSAESVRVE